jgi:hypothetical protein
MGDAPPSRQPGALARLGPVVYDCLAMASQELVPYVVRRGDHLLKIALKMGFDAKTIWQDPKNAALRASRPSMNVLCVGDVLYVPKQPAREWKPIKTGSANPFVATVPAVQVAVKFLLEGQPLASAACTIRELANLGSLTTTSDGTLKFEAPVALETVTVEFSDVDLVQPLCIGHLDPTSTPSGAYQRLDNLGYVLADPTGGSALDPGSLRESLSAFQSSEGVSDVMGNLDDATQAKLKSVYGC